MSMSTCRTQSDSMLENHTLVALGKEMKNGWGGEGRGVTTRGRKASERG